MVAYSERFVFNSQCCYRKKASNWNCIEMQIKTEYNGDINSYNLCIFSSQNSGYVGKFTILKHTSSSDMYTKGSQLTNMLLHIQSPWPTWQLLHTVWRRMQRPWRLDLMLRKIVFQRSIPTPNCCNLQFPSCNRKARNAYSVNIAIAYFKYKWK